MNGVLYVALGGALGASGRYGLGLWASRVFHDEYPIAALTEYPLGTLIANVLGGFFMGVLMVWIGTKAGAENLRLLLGVGFLGGFTTFSAFSLEAITMIENRTYGMAAGYIALSVSLSLLALFAGLIITRRVLSL